MNVLIILGSPRKNGNSETLAKGVLEGLGETMSHDPEFIYLHGMKDISPCRGCGGCEKSGNCVINDGMTELYQKVDNADVIFLVTPVYCYGPSAQIKAFIDRFQARWSRKYLLQERHRAGEKRFGYLLSTAATKGPKVFDATLLIAKSFYDTIDVKYGGELLVRSVDEKGALKKNEEEVSKALQLGRDIAAAFAK